MKKPKLILETDKLKQMRQERSELTRALNHSFHGRVDWRAKASCERRVNALGVEIEKIEAELKATHDIAMKAFEKARKSHKKDLEKFKKAQEEASKTFKNPISGLDL